MEVDVEQQLKLDSVRVGARALRTWGSQVTRFVDGAMSAWQARLQEVAPKLGDALL